MTPIRAAGTLDLTVHLRDPDIEPKLRPAKGADSRYRALTDVPENRLETPRLQVREWEGHAGATVCGRFLLLEELWVDHTPEPADPRCPACFTGEAVDDDPDLWTDVDEYAEYPDDDTPPARPVTTVPVVGGVL